MRKMGRYSLNKIHTNRSHHTDSALMRVFDQSQMGACIITQTGSKILYVNPYFLRLTGYCLEAVIGHSINDFVFLDSPEKSWIKSSLLRIKGFIHDETITVRFESGGHINLKVSLDTLEFNHLHCVLAIIFGSDDPDLSGSDGKLNNTQLEEWVKERSFQFSQLNRSLFETQIKQKAILDNIPDMAWLKDRDGHFIAVNQPFALACGLSVDNVMGKTDLDLWPVELAERYRTDDAEVIKVGQLKKVEERFVDSSGHETWIETIKAPIYDEKHDVIGTTGIARDISQRKQIEDDRLKLKTELEQIVQDRTRELALINQHLKEEIEKHRRVDKIQAAVYQIAQSTNLSENLTVLFRSVHQILGTLMPVQNFFIALYDPETEIISFPYFVDEHDHPPEPRKIDHGITAYVLRTGKPLLASPKVFESLVQENQVDNMGAPSIDWLGVPLPTKNGIIGVLAVQSYQVNIRFGEVERDILVFVSNQIGLAIDRVLKEEGLRESEARYRAVVENQTDLICR